MRAYRKKRYALFFLFRIGGVNQKCTAVRQHIHISSQLFGVKEVGYVKDTTAGNY